MNENEINRREPESGDVLKLFGAGLAGWLAALVALYGLSWRLAGAESPASATIWAISHWWAAFAAGALALVAYGMVAKIPLGRGLLGFLLPVAVLGGLSALCFAIYPDVEFKEDLLVFLSMIFFFYGVGFCWLALTRGRRDSKPFAQAVVPAFSGGAVILGAVAVPTFASDAFRYRNAFEFMVRKSALQDGALVCEGTLTIFKPGNYRFSAPRYVWAMEGSDDSNPGVELGAIEWGLAGEPKAGASGEFPARITWRKDLPKTGSSDPMAGEEGFWIEVRNRADNNRVVYSLAASAAGR